MLRESILCKNSLFRSLSLATLFSRFGDAIMSIAVLWAIYSISHSALEVGIITVVELLPFFIFSLYSGVMVDRFDPKKIMVISDVSRFILLVLLTVFWIFNIDRIVSLYIIIFLVSVFSSFFGPSSQAVIKNIVDSEDMVSANSWLQTIRTISSLVGVLCGGLIVGFLGVSNSFFLNGITFLISALFLFFSRMPQIKRVMKKTSIYSGLKEAFQYLMSSSPQLKQSLFYLIIINFAISPLSILITIIAGESSLHSNALGILSACLSIGALLGSFIAKRLLRVFRTPFIIPIFIIVFCVTSGFPSLDPPFLLSGVFFIMSGICSSLTLVYVNTFFIENTNKEFIGRISSFRSLSLRIPPPIMALLYGWFVGRIGVSKSTLIIELLTVLLSLFVFFKYHFSNKIDNENDRITETEVT